MLATDVSCIIEVADRSLYTDRSGKRSLYAAAMLQQYVIVNLVDRVVEDYRLAAQGGYPEPAIYKRGDAFEVVLPDGSSLAVEVASVVPR